MKKRKTILSLILSVAMLLGTLPSGMVFAADIGQYTVSLASSAEIVDSGKTVDVSVDVTSGSQSTYNAFYAVLSYDYQKFDYSGDAAVNGFSVDSSTTGTLKISRVGSVVSISDRPDLSLTFTAKSGGEGTFSLTSAKVDEAANAEKDAPEANNGAPITIGVVPEGGSLLIVMPSEHGTVRSNVSTQKSIYGGYGLICTPEDGYQLKDLYYTFDDGPAEQPGLSYSLNWNSNGTIWQYSLSPFKPEGGYRGSGIYRVYAEFVKDEGTDGFIHTAEELCDLSKAVSENLYETRGKKYELAADIDLTDQDWRTIKVFMGELEGNGHTVTGLDAPLIGSLLGGTVRNIKTEGSIQFYPDEEYWLSGTEYWSSSSGSNGRYVCGALVNTVYGDGFLIENCVNQTDIDTNSNTGGIAAFVNGFGQIRNCQNYGSIHSVSKNAGGIIGEISQYSEVSVQSCQNYGSVRNTTESYGNANASGGITGYSSGELSIESSGNYADIQSAVEAGGLIGCQRPQARLVIRKSLNKGPVSAVSQADAYDSLAGGLVGTAGIYTTAFEEPKALIESCYNTGKVSAEAPSLRDGKNPCAAGLVGIQDQEIFIDIPEGTPDELDDFKDNITICNSYNTGIVSTSDGVTVTSLTEQDETAVYNLGELVPYKMLFGNSHFWFKEYIITDRVASLQNCLRKTEVTEQSPETAVKTLNAAEEDAFKVDINGVNQGQTPLLIWEEDTTDTSEYAISFAVEGAETYDLKVYADESQTQILEPDEKGVYRLKSGSYSYRVTAEGCLPKSGKFSVLGKDRTIPVALEQGDTVIFETTPQNTEVQVNGQKPVSSESGRHTFVLKKGGSFTYSASTDGYLSISHEFTASDGMVIRVALEPSAWTPTEDDYIYGDGNEGKPHTVTKGGIYQIGDGATGVLTVETDEPVTLVGTGTAKSSAFEDLYIDCRKEGAMLTLRDVYISNMSGNADPKMSNLIGFTGKGNQLQFIGTSILDQDTNASGYALIHAPKGTELTIRGGTAYIYKREQGAGIGGNGSGNGGAGMTPETNGTITIQDARLFMKSTKQGALIGAGANADQLSPDPIHILGSELYLITTARGSAIGGSAGSSHASSGTQVTVDSKSTVTINVDFSGSAIGGGGFDSGNDADGGTLVYRGGSVRTYIDVNAVSSWRDFGVTEAGINGNIGITSTIQDEAGNPVYLAMLDTAALIPSEDGTYTVKEGSSEIYAGGLHKYKYVNETLDKGQGQQVQINYTIDNWVPLDDPNLYLYLTGEDHTLDVNGQIVKATWNEETKSFTVTVEGTVDPPEAADKSLLEEALKAAQDAQKDVRISEDGSDVDPADQWVPQSAADALTEAIGAAQAVMENKEVTQQQVDQAVTTLNSAVKAFEEAKKPGTKSHDASCPSKAFSDLDTGKWYHEAIDYVLLKNYFNGVGDGKFAPDGTMTRAMFVTVLGRAAGVEEDKNAHSSFSDVADGKWYTSYVDWAAQNDIVDGYDSKTFGPDDFITREQMAVILYRYAKYRKVDTSGTDASKFNAFKDKDTVSGWAVEAMTWAAGCGLINGMGDGTLAPQETATRSQVAQIVMNYEKAA